mgnify:CR=1 FL=1
MSKLYDQLRNAARARREAMERRSQAESPPSPEQSLESAPPQDGDAASGEGRVTIAQLALQREAELRAAREARARADGDEQLAREALDRKEADLAARFGEPYRQYTDHVRCWIPARP